jgi:hypothetical protein
LKSSICGYEAKLVVGEPVLGRLAPVRKSSPL